MEQLLQSLPGFWMGEAIETPVGRMNYDIVFHTCSDGIIAGVAKTDASLHYWQFIRNQDNHRIRFLSTFIGNRIPIVLLPQPTEGRALSYYAPDLKMLTLAINHSPSIIDIRVFHHGKPHVRIQLTQEDGKQVQLPPHHSLSNSCRGFPIEQ
ncbi:MAG: hypothetical protein JAY64_19960 [Candidatus Thiodiazotropha weberae]|nr:hypothetical protein [Candidatus Thiodiazotropha lotti]MCG8013954.1 hypothetical protein [Candidatus Thiodiazotropha lotti]MCW4213435.1 hypothetical protein [Candidatus Thiodiazotropha lotti]MCW4215640.1 hypothetical protein [Candidatus Thiodiazotropha lotti]